MNGVLLNRYLVTILCSSYTWSLGALLWPDILPVSSFAIEYICLYAVTTVLETELLRGEEQPQLKTFICFQTPAFRHESAWSDSLLINEGIKVDENKNLLYFLTIYSSLFFAIIFPLFTSFSFISSSPRSFPSSSTCFFIFIFDRLPLLPLLRRPFSSSMP